MSDTGHDHIVGDLLRQLDAGLVRRIEAVERDNRRLRRLSRVTIALLAGVVVAGTGLLLGTDGAIPEVVEARQFVVRDDDGTPVAVFGLQLDETVGLSLRDSGARERLRMILLPDGAPGVSFADSRGRSRAVLGLLPDQSASLVFADREGRARTFLGMSADESSTLVFTDVYGFTRAGLGVDRLGLASLTLVDDVSVEIPDD